MIKLETANTKHNRGEVEYNSPTNYEIRSKLTGQFIQRIDIQKGPVQHAGEVNGIFIEDLILVCIDQLEHFQNSDYACDENERTLHHLRCALDTTRARQYERLSRGVQGRMQK